MRIKYLNGSLEGKEHTLKGPLVTFGRDSSNTIMLNDPGISSRHAILEQTGDIWTVYDNDSTNGVFINDTKMQKKEELHDDDIIGLGNDFHIKILEGALPPRPQKPTEDVILAGIPAQADEETKSADSSEESEPKKELEKTSDTAKKVAVIVLDEKTSAPSKDKKTDSKKISTKSSKLKSSESSKKKAKAVSLSPEEKEETRNKRREKHEERRRKIQKIRNKNRAALAVVVLVMIFSLYYVVPGFIEAFKPEQNTSAQVSQTDQTSAKINSAVNQNPQNQQTQNNSVVPANIPLYVQSYPAGATFEIDGEIVGTTPMEIPKLENGAHTLTLYKDGYKATEYFFNHPSSPVQVHTLELQDSTALITSTPPGAAILIGGQLQGHTPYMMKNIKAGTTQISLTAPGFSTETFLLRVSSSEAREHYHLTLADDRGSVAVITSPPGCKIILNQDDMGLTTADKSNKIISAPFVLDDLLPGNYELTVSSPDGSEKKTEKITVKGGEVTQKAVRISMVNALLKLNDDTQMYGMVVAENETGIKFAAKKVNDDLLEVWKEHVLTTDQVASITPSTLQDMLGYTKGIKLRADNFKPILASIYDEDDDNDYKEMIEDAEDGGEISATQIDSDYKSLDFISMQGKYMNKKIIVTGKVTLIREGELMYSIVFNDRIECYISKDDNPDLKDTLAALKNRDAKVSGYCIGIKGLDRIVVMGGTLK